MDDKHVCPICGKPTAKSYGNYQKDGLCVEHSQQKKDGLIFQCDKCGQWHKTGEKCNVKKIFAELPHEGFDHCVLCGKETDGVAFCKECYMKFPNHELLAMLNEKQTSKEQSKPVEETKEEKEDNIVIINSENKSRCITCGRQTDGLLFCPICYHKYNKMELLFRITECSKIELLDSSYENKIRCKDGHIVKSKSEKFIDDFLYEKKIFHAYEKALPYSLEKDLHPDFYLPNYLGEGMDVYIEHWGYNENNIDYTESKKFKMNIYRDLCKKKKITLVCTHEKKEIGDIEAVLERKLNKDFIIPYEINGEE